jgi:hypothetical protein
MPSDYVPLLILFAIAAVIAAVMVGGSWLLGPKRPSLAKGSPYECGITPVGSAEDPVEPRRLKPEPAPVLNAPQPEPVAALPGESR